MSERISGVDYVELAVTTNFSFLRGASHPEEMVVEAARLGLAGLSVTDRNSLAGVVRAHMAAKEAGLAFAPGMPPGLCRWHTGHSCMAAGPGCLWPSV